MGSFHIYENIFFQRFSDNIQTKQMMKADENWENIVINRHFQNKFVSG